MFQQQTDKPISEREIYHRAKTANIISDELFESLGRLYDDRNRVIHRYVISRITTADVLDIARAYESAIGDIFPIVYKLEEEQIRTGIGMTEKGSGFDRKSLEQFAEEKHTTTLANLLRR